MSRYIDADALIVNMRGAFIDHIEEFRAITIIKDAPSIDIEPKRGEWIDNRGASDKSQLFSFECSECHDVNERTTNFCPNCGCAMTKESE